MPEVLGRAMKLNLSTFLYGSALSNVPLFRGLSREVIGALCSRVRPMYVMKDQDVVRPNPRTHHSAFSLARL